VKARFTVTPRVVGALAFSVIAARSQIQRMLDHKHPHKPSIDRARDALIVLETIHAASVRVSSEVAQ
jgi:hypothetical protein